MSGFDATATAFASAFGYRYNSPTVYFTSQASLFGTFFSSLTWVTCAVVSVIDFVEVLVAR